MIWLQTGAWPWLWLARLPRLATCLGVGRCQKTHWLGGLLISGQPLRLDSACLGLSCFTSRRFAFASLPTVCHILSLVRLWGLTFGRPNAHHQRHGIPFSIIEKVSQRFILSRMPLPTYPLVGGYLVGSEKPLKPA